MTSRPDSIDTEPEISNRFRSAAQTLGALLAIIGTLWIAWLLTSSLDDLDSVIPPPSWILLGSSLALCAFFVFNGLAFRTLLKSEQASFNRNKAIESFYIAQLLRYLPGRVWGYVFQIAKTGPGERCAVVIANIDFSIIAILVHTTVCMLLAGILVGWPLSITYGVPLACLFALAARYSIFGNKMVQSMLTILATRHASWQHSSALQARSACTLGIAAGLLIAGLGLYAFAWTGLAVAHPALSEVPMLELSALYALSSIIGMLSVVTPGGLGVREGSFVGLGLGIAPPETLALLAVLMRVWMMSMEVFVALVAVVVLRLSNVRTSATRRRNYGIDQHG